MPRDRCSRCLPFDSMCICIHHVHDCLLACDVCFLLLLFLHHAFASILLSCLFPFTCSCALQLLLLVLDPFLFYLLLNFNLVSPKFLSHPNLSFSLSFNYFSSGIFCSRLMSTIFLYSLHHAKTTSSSFQALWKCFGWAKDLVKLE